MVEFPREYIIDLYKKHSDTIKRATIFKLGRGASHWLVWNENTDTFWVGGELAGLTEQILKKSVIVEDFLIVLTHALRNVKPDNMMIMYEEELDHALQYLKRNVEESPRVVSYLTEYNLCLGEKLRRKAVCKKKGKIQPPKSEALADDPPEEIVQPDAAQPPTIEAPPGWHKDGD